jgi:hypothetical protein
MLRVGSITSRERTMDDHKSRRDEHEQEDRERDARESHEPRRPNPPYTTKGKVTAPKFGSAGSGGAEIEPGPERD